MLDYLPQRLAYLKAPAENIAKQDPDLIGCGEFDATAFETALRREMAPLSPDEAESRCQDDLRELEAWLHSHNRPGDLHVLALWAILGQFTAAYEILNPASVDDHDERWAPEFDPRLATMQLPEHFSLARSGQEILVTDGVASVLVREIDARSFAILADEFSTPKRKTKLPDGTVVHPKSLVSINNLVGSKNVSEREGRAEITYLLKSDEWFALVKLEAPANVDFTPYELLLGLIAFR